MTEITDDVRCPDITGAKGCKNLTSVWTTGVKVNDAFITEQNDYRMSLSSTGGLGRFYDLFLKASNGNSKYGASETVQPSSMMLMPIIKI